MSTTNHFVSIEDDGRSNAVVSGQAAILEQIATGAPLTAVLGALARFVEQQGSSVLCSVLLLDPDGLHLRHGAAPSLPDTYNQAIDGIRIGPCAGSCGTAAYLREPVVVADVSCDPRWANYRELALNHGLRACWSTPILATTGDVLGTFAMYDREPSSPTPADFSLIAVATHLAQIAIERDRAEREHIEVIRLEAARAESEGARAQISGILESITDAFFALDRSGRFTYINREAKRLFAAYLGRTRDEMIGKPLWEEFREVISPHFVEQYRRAVVERVPVAFEECYPPLDRWFELRAYPTPDGLSVYFRDITERKRAEEERAQLIAAVERERSILEATMGSMLDGLIVVDQEYRIRYYNLRAAEILGVESYQVIGKLLDDALTGFLANVEGPESALAAFETARADLTNRPSFEVTFRGPPRRNVLIQMFPVVSASGTVLGGAALLRDVTAAKLLAVLQERERIAMDLHDGVIQQLYAVGLAVAARERTLDADLEKTRALLRHTRRRIEGIIQEIRNDIFDLRLRELGEHGLGAGLEALAEELRINALISPELTIGVGFEDLLDQETVANVLQIAREATSNVIRHARASSVKITLRRSSQMLCLTIEDNGRGFDPTARSRDESGQGLRNMLERARTFGGHLDVDSRAGRGTVVQLDIPLSISMEHRSHVE